MTDVKIALWVMTAMWALMLLSTPWLPLGAFWWFIFGVTTGFIPMGWLCLEAVDIANEALRLLDDEEAPR